MGSFVGFDSMGVWGDLVPILSWVWEGSVLGCGDL